MNTYHIGSAVLDVRTRARGTFNGVHQQGRSRIAVVKFEYGIRHVPVKWLKLVKQ